MKLVRELEHLSCEVRLRMVGLFSLEKSFGGGLMATFQSEGVTGKRDTFSGTVVIGQWGWIPTERGEFRLDIGKIFFTVRVVNHWNRLPRVAEDALVLAVFKVRLDKA